MRPNSPANSTMIPNTMANDAGRLSHSASSSASVKNRKNRLNSRMVSATMKKTLPCTPLRTSAVTSALASSTSARTSVDICAVASLTRPPMDWSAGAVTGSGESGIDGSTGGTSAPLELVELATAVLLHVLGRFVRPLSKTTRPSFHSGPAARRIWIAGPTRCATTASASTALAAPGRGACSSAAPIRLAAAEASSTAAFAESSSGPSSASASSAISRLTVNPTPPSIDTASRSRQPRPAGRRAGVSRMASQQKPKMPITFPTSRPTITPSAIGSSDHCPQRLGTDRNPGREQREHRHAEPGRPGLQPVLETQRRGLVALPGRGERG